MKQNYFKNSMIVAGLFFLSTISFVSCEDDDNDSNTPLIEDGVYVKIGTEDLNINNLMSDAVNEAKSNAVRHGLLEKYIYLTQGATGFTIVSVSGTNQTVYGVSTKADSMYAGRRDQSKDVTITNGKTIKNGTAFTVAASGLFHIAIDTVIKRYTIVPVNKWGIIGAATAAGWGGQTDIPIKTASATGFVFEATGIRLDKGEFKLRHSNGWKAELADSMDVKINTNFGGVNTNMALTLVPGGTNYNVAGTNRGIYTINITWSPASADNFGYTVAFTKTADIEIIDYSAYNMGIIGNAYMKADGTTPADWDGNYPNSTQIPVKVGNVYTWTYDNITLIADKSFKFRQGENWDGKSWGYGAFTWAGAAKSNFTDAGGDIKVGTAGTYKFVLTIDASTETYTLTVTKY
jgi:hypothetical protein